MAIKYFKKWTEDLLRLFICLVYSKFSISRKAVAIAE